VSAATPAKSPLPDASFCWLSVNRRKQNISAYSYVSRVRVERGAFFIVRRDRRIPISRLTLLLRCAIEIRIADPDTLEQLPTGQQGMILVNGPSRMPGRARRNPVLLPSNPGVDALSGGNSEGEIKGKRKVLPRPVDNPGGSVQNRVSSELWQLPARSKVLQMRPSAMLRSLYGGA
jgi:acyl-CoA synthetase (AMP-forming)/AMP-acid ligase II